MHAWRAPSAHEDVWITAKHLVPEGAHVATLSPSLAAFRVDDWFGAGGGRSALLEIAGYLGSGAQFDEAMGVFAIAYADQAERDHAALKAAVRKGDITAYQEA